jgi:hypothetical protein
MAQHIRNKPEEQHMAGMQHIRKREEPGYKHLMASTMQRIRSSPKMMMGMLFGFILMIILIIVALHYFRLYSFPFLTAYIPQKPAPSSHLQYFFF